MRTVKLIIEYDGTNYCGWQTQHNGVSVQETIKKAIGRMAAEEATLIGSSRTDAGVHALGQVAHFKTQSSIPAKGFLNGLNSLLPSDIRIINAQDVHADFHALRDAQGKHYRYILSTAAVPSALCHNRAWHVHQPLDIDMMRKAAKMLIGKHDFSAFKASGSSVKDAVRTIHSLEVGRLRRTTSGIPCPVSGIKIDVSGNGFVRHMIRNIAGWLVEVGRGRISLAEAKGIFLGKKRTEAGVCAPASGLYLMQVFY